jgi:hypothetical protein
VQGRSCANTTRGQRRGAIARGRSARLGLRSKFASASVTFWLKGPLGTLCSFALRRPSAMVRGRVRRGRKVIVGNKFHRVSRYWLFLQVSRMTLTQAYHIGCRRFCEYHHPACPKDDSDLSDSSHGAENGCLI